MVPLVLRARPRVQKCQAQCRNYQEKHELTLNTLCQFVSSWVVFSFDFRAQNNAVRYNWRSQNCKSVLLRISQECL